MLKVLERTLAMPEIQVYGLSVPDSVYDLSIIDSVYSLSPMDEMMNLPGVMTMGNSWSDPEVIAVYVGCCRPSDSANQSQG